MFALQVWWLAQSITSKVSEIMINEFTVEINCKVTRTCDINRLAYLLYESNRAM